jgi:hypothetical protein
VDKLKAKMRKTDNLFHLIVKPNDLLIGCQKFLFNVLPEIRGDVVLIDNYALNDELVDIIGHVKLY